MVVGYLGKEVDYFEFIVDENVQWLIDLFDIKYIFQGKVFDFGYKVFFFILDVIFVVVFGEVFGDLEVDLDVYGYIYVMEESMFIIIIMIVMFWIMKLLQMFVFKGMLLLEKDVVGVG